jgi:hypothetical protein
MHENNKAMAQIRARLAAFAERQFWIGVLWQGYYGTGRSTVVHGDDKNNRR